jgi:hypothetical protein
MADREMEIFDGLAWIARQMSALSARATKVRRREASYIRK